MTSRLIIGILVNVEMWSFFLLNVVCLFCMFRSRLFAKEDNPAYLITSFNLLSETCQLLVHITYVGPSILLGTWFFEDQSSLGVTIIATWFLGFWYLGSFIQILMAMNRLCVVFLQGRKILTHARIGLIMLAMFLVALACVIYSQLISPCCRITPDYRYFAYSYLVFENQTENPSMVFIDLPIDFSTSIICAISYISLFAYVWKMGHSETGVRKREMKLCFQFLIMFLCYTVTWSTFFLFPKLGIKIPEPYVTTTAVFMANCGVNAVIYLTINREIKFELKKILGKVSHSAVYNSSVTKIPNQPSRLTAATVAKSNSVVPELREEV